MVELAESLQNYYEIDPYFILPREGVLEQTLKDKNFRYSIVKYQWTVHGLGSSIQSQIKRIVKNLQLRKQTNRLLNELNPNFIYINTSVSVFPSFYAFFKKIPFAIHLREFGDLDYSLSPDFNGILLKISSRISKYVIANSYAVKSYYFDKYKILSTVLYNGLSYEKDFYQKKSLREIAKSNYTSTFKFAIIGRIREEKGQLLALQALNYLKNNNIAANLEIIGGGDIAPIKDFVEENGLESIVTIVGQVEDVDLYYPKIDCVLVCSTNEAFGRISVEAMSFGIPVLGLKNAGTLEIVEDRVTGLTFSNNYIDLAEKMILIKEDINLYNSLSYNGWNHAKNNFNLEKYSETFFKNYLANI